MSAPAVEMAPELTGRNRIRECAGCGRPISRQPTLHGPDVVALVGRGCCRRCYREVRFVEGRPVADGLRRRRRDAVVQLPALQQTEWTRRAACREAPDRTAFLPEEGERERIVPPRAVVAARRYCGGCPVLDECHEFAERFREVGLWAGAWRNGGEVTPIRTKYLPGEAP